MDSAEKLKPGGQPGHRKFQRQPFTQEQIDKVIEYELDEKDAVGLTVLDEWLVIQQIELPEKMYYVPRPIKVESCRGAGPKPFDFASKD
jgi:hypothetical protein